MAPGSLKELLAASAKLQPPDQQKRGRKPALQGEAKAKANAKAKARAKAKAKASSGKRPKAKAQALARSPVANEAAEEEQPQARRTYKRKQKPAGTSEVATGVEEHAPGKADEEQMKATSERKARISRKSAAYHRAMKQACLDGMTTGQAKIEGRKVIRLLHIFWVSLVSPIWPLYTYMTWCFIIWMANWGLCNDRVINWSKSIGLIKLKFQLVIGKLATGVLCQDCEMLVCSSDAWYGNRKHKLKVYMLSSVIMVLALFFASVWTCLCCCSKFTFHCDISDVIALMANSGVVWNEFVFGETLDLVIPCVVWSCHQWIFDFAPWIMNHSTHWAGFRYCTCSPWPTCLGSWIPAECPSWMYLFWNAVIKLCCLLDDSLDLRLLASCSFNCMQQLFVFQMPTSVQLHVLFSWLTIL